MMFIINCYVWLQSCDKILFLQNISILTFLYLFFWSCLFFSLLACTLSCRKLIDWLIALCSRYEAELISWRLVVSCRRKIGAKSIVWESRSGKVWSDWLCVNYYHLPTAAAGRCRGRSQPVEVSQTALSSLSNAACTCLTMTSAHLLLVFITMNSRTILNRPIRSAIGQTRVHISIPDFSQIYCTFFSHWTVRWAFGSWSVSPALNNRSGIAAYQAWVNDSVTKHYI